MTRTMLGFMMAPVLGLLAMVVPVLLWPPARHYEAPLFPLLRSAVENIGLPQLILLFASGLALGFVSSSRARYLGAAAIAFLPLATLAEMIKDPTSHNLFPLEFATYAFYGFLVACGVFAVHRVRGLETPSAMTSESVI